MTLLVLLLITIVGSALFAGLETGLVTANRVRLRVQAGRGDAGARRILAYLDRPERILSTFLVGNTLCNVGGGALATAWAAGVFGETLGSLLATAGMTCIFLVFSEMVPKSYFRKRGELAVPRLLWFIRGTGWLFAPVALAASGFFRLVTGASGRSPFVTREELRQLLRESGGPLAVGERRMLESVFDFGKTTAREVMIPLPEVASLPETAGPEELRKLVRRRGFTRIPLYRDRVDQIVGIVTVFDVLYASTPKADLRGYLRPMLIVPETKRIPPILVDLQRRREAMALVVNEFGACTGIVTLEDIIEEIMGELADEHEELRQPIQRTGDGWVIDASLDIDDLNNELGLSLRKDQFETVAGLVLKHAGRIPRPGERVRIGNLEFEVVAVHQYGIRRLKLTRHSASKEGTAHDG